MSSAFGYKNLVPNQHLKNTDYQKIIAEIKDLPKGVSSFDFTWQLRKTNIVGDFAMVFAAGFVGFEQDKKTKALRPVVHWAVYDKNAPKLP